MGNSLVRSVAELRETVARGVRVLTREGLLRNAGHVSARLPQKDMFWTLRHVHIGLERVGPGDIVACDLRGQVVDSVWDAPGERFIHCAIYARRPDVQAIVHCHPSFATAISVAGSTIEPLLMLGADIGHVPVYQSPEPVESYDQGMALADALGAARAVLMRGHGLTTVGKTVEEACAIAVMLEETARTQLLARLIGTPVPIDVRGKEEVFRRAFVHFLEVFWAHHTQPREAESFLGRPLL